MQEEMSYAPEVGLEQDVCSLLGENTQKNKEEFKNIVNFIIEVCIYFCKDTGKKNYPTLRESN